MDDNIKNSSLQSENITAPAAQPPILETVAIDDNLQPEELPPDVATPAPEEISQTGPEIIPPAPPMYQGGGNRWQIIGIGAAIFIVIFLVLFKFIFNKKPTSQPIKLSYWGLWEEKEIFDPLIQQYKNEHPEVTIDYQKMSPQEYKDRLIARGVKGLGPDIFRFHNTWLPEIKEVVTPIPNQIMTVAEFEKIFYKVHQQDLKVDKYYYGIPLMIDGLVLIYNDSLLKKAGIETVPSNWDEMTEAVSRLTVKDISGQIITAGLALGTSTNVEHFSDIFGLMLLQNGGNLSQLDQPEAAGALESYRKFAEPPTDFWNDLMPNSLVAFSQEKVAMIIAPSWEILTIKTTNPDINLKVAPVPAVPGGKPVNLASYWVEGVSRYGTHQLEAWKFLKFLVDKNNLTKLYEQQSKVRIFGEAYSRIDLAPLLAQNQYLGPVIKQADHYVSLPLISRTFDNGLNDEIIQYIENAINATSQGISYSQALETAKKGIDQVYTKYGIK